MKQSVKINRVGMSNLPMSDATYQLRRKVISIIYECLKLDRNLPRVEVRIVEAHKNVLGKASIFSKVPHISIMASVCQATEDMLYHVTLHELVHTWFDMGHNENCKLMSSVIKKPLKKSESMALFKKYLNEHKAA